MQRSQSSISIDSIKQKKFWRSFTGSSSSTGTSTTTVSTQSPSPKESSTRILETLQRQSSIVRQTATSNKLPTISEPQIPPSHSRSLTKAKNRQSLAITNSEIRMMSQGSTTTTTSTVTASFSSSPSSSPTSTESTRSTSNRRESYINRPPRHQSSYNLSSHLQLDDQLQSATTDPKELEFYKSLLSRAAKDLPSSKEKITESEEEVLDVTNEALMTTTTQATINTDLSSALADYRLFTSKKLDFSTYDATSPTSSNFNPTLHSHIVSSTSIPSFSGSVDTLMSDESIKYVGGVLLVGIESEELTEELNVKKQQEQQQDSQYWCDVEAVEIFKEERGLMMGELKKIGNRTSLAFL